MMQETPFIDRFKLARRLFLSDYAAKDADGKVLPGEKWDPVDRDKNFGKFATELQPFVMKPKMAPKQLLDQSWWLADFCSRSTEVFVFRLFFIDWIAFVDQQSYSSNYCPRRAFKK